MAIQNEPTRISTPFADAGTKNVIPETMSQPSATAAASWQAGFPTVCSLPLSAGGIPPARNDFNGLLNQMTQTERFLQDGGIFSWSATTDYGANRLVLGSDGKLYWSVAQSGPNTGAGSVDPTTDSGTYWGSLPMKTPGLGDDGEGLATTRWVKSLAEAPIYVDPVNGNDSNGGFEQTSAVKTITKALDIAATCLGQTSKIYLAAGIYTENIEIYDRAIVFELQGNVNISGYIQVRNFSYMYVAGSSFTLSVSGYVNAETNSSIILECAISITSNSSYRGCLDIEDGSYCACYSVCTIIQPESVSAYGIICVNNAGAIFYEDVTLTCYGNNTKDGCAISRNSSIRCLKNLSINGSGCIDALSTSQNSSFDISGSLTVAEGVASMRAVYLSTNSCFTSNSPTPHILHGGTTGDAVFLVQENSSVHTEGGSGFTLFNHGSSNSLYLYNGGAFVLFNGEELIFETEVGKTPAFLINCESAIVELRYGSTVNFGTATVDKTVQVSFNGFMYISNGVTVSGNITGGRYIVDYGGQIYTQGAGEDRIPGSTSGYVNSASYGYYH